MAFHELESVRCTLSIVQDIKCYSYILHLFSDSVSPEGIVILLIKLKSMGNRSRNFDAKLVCSFQEAGLTLLHKRDDSVTLL